MSEIFVEQQFQWTYQNQLGIAPFKKRGKNSSEYRIVISLLKPTKQLDSLYVI